MLPRLDNVHKRYPLPRERLLGAMPGARALHGVSLAIQAGRSLGVVGESGSGKSTLARIAMALESPKSDRVDFLGGDLSTRGASALRAAPRDLQMDFQDLCGSLDPLLAVGRIVERGETARLFGDPQHPYTRALMAAHESDLPPSATVAPVVEEPR